MRLVKKLSVLMLLLTFSLLNAGCLSGSLAISPAELDPPQWTTADKQVFPPAQYLNAQFIIRKSGQDRPIDALGLADYCVFEVDSIRYFASANENGVFQTEIDVPRAPNDTSIAIRATAFKTRGRPDFMDIGGEWLMAESPLDMADRRVAGDRLKLIVQRNQSTQNQSTQNQSIQNQSIQGDSMQPESIGHMDRIDEDTSPESTGQVSTTPTAEP